MRHRRKSLSHSLFSTVFFRFIFMVIVKRMKKEKTQDRLSRKRRARRRSRMIYFSLMVVGAAIFLLIFFNLPQLTINQVEVEGAVVLPVDDLNREALTVLTGRYLGILPKANILFYPRGELVERIKNTYRRIQSADLHVKNLTTVILSVTERKPFGYWCGVKELVDPTFVQNCFFLDETGFIFQAAPSFYGTSFLKFFGGVSGDDPVGQRFLTPERFGEINLFLNELTSLGLKPIGFGVLPDGGGYEVLLMGGGRIFVSAEKNLGEAILNLGTLLNKTELKEIKTNTTLKLDYIDLRYGNRIYYKLRD